MKSGKFLFRIFLGVVVVLAIQFTTYHTISQRMLEAELLGPWYQRLVHDADSAYVSDFIVVDCSVGETSVYRSHNLKKDEAKLCGMLKVKSVKFEDRETFSWNDRTRYGYDLIYYTWTRYPMSSIDRNWVALDGFYASQYEIVHMDKVSHGRTVHYLWALFGWIEISDDVYSTGPEDRKAMLVRLGRFEDIRQ
jgi:hypothetical protein